MTSDKLKECCQGRFGQRHGGKLYQAMRRIVALNLCVATGWGDDDISVAFDCEYNGTIFKLNGNRSSIYLPENNGIINLRRVTRSDIVPFLPRGSGGNTNCFYDSEGPVEN